MRLIAHVTDIHLDEAYTAECGVKARRHWQILLADLDRRGIGELVFGGDIGEAAVFADFFASLAHFSPKLRIVLGNHDKFADTRRYFLHPTAGPGDELYYAEEDAHGRYLFLDSSSGEIGSAQSTWLAGQLESPKRVVIFIHHPIMPVEAVVDRLYPLKGRERIEALLRQHAKPVVIFCGHYHFADEQTVGNITQYITPAASFQVKKTAPDFATTPGPFGYRLIMLDGAKLSSEAVLLS
jgi:3',5'-cyclic-AMP phosphodiesterase